MIDRTRAERQRRYRQRQKRGLRVVSVEVDDRSITNMTELLQRQNNAAATYVSSVATHKVSEGSFMMMD